MLTWNEACTRYPSIFEIDKQTGALNIYADHHMLSTLRTCEGITSEAIVNRIGPKQGRSWYLEFGIWMHRALEIFYEAEKVGTNISCPEWVELSMAEWAAMDMSVFANASGFKKLGGPAGALTLLVEYYQMYGGGKEKLKIIGTELPFGRDKEVPLGSFQELQFDIPPDPLIGKQYWTDKPEFVDVNCFLTGRIDDVVDDGVFIMPFDTKTKSRFDGNEADAYSPHEGMCGYVYALNSVLGKYFPGEARKCNKVLINHVQVSPCQDYADRFKRTPVVFSDAQLEAWRVRQLSTFRKMYELLVLERDADWQTGYCSNLFGSACPYRQLHSHDLVHRDLIIKSDYVKIDVWDTYNPDKNKQNKTETSVQSE